MAQSQLWAIRLILYLLLLAVSQKVYPKITHQIVLTVSHTLMDQMKYMTYVQVCNITVWDYPKHSTACMYDTIEVVMSMKAETVGTILGGVFAIAILLHGSITCAAIVVKLVTKKGIIVTINF